MKRAPSLVWFRRDLRLGDNPALRAAVARGGPVLPVFVFAPGEEGEWAPGAASCRWLQQSLESLLGDLAQRGSRLLVRRGESAGVLQQLARESGAGAVFWNRLYEPELMARDAGVEIALRSAGLEVTHFNAGLLWEPGSVEKRGGGPYRVFSPFWRACLAQGAPEAPASAPGSLQAPERWPETWSLQSMGLAEGGNWSAGWEPGEEGARARLSRFVQEDLEQYGEQRDRPDLRGTSALSPHLHFGEVGPRQIWDEVVARRGREGVRGSFLRELAWREFAHHLLYHYPHIPQQPLRAEFAAFPWEENAEGLRAWQKGRTGYPLVDAGMRQLRATGWMHNRVRMVASSFLVKDLLLPWQEGARWFWEMLVDADLANNTLGWQWTAGCGADAAPFFRIFNPVLQGEKFDPGGQYVRQWVPELAALPKRWVHRPWKAPDRALAEAELKLGQDYPLPVVDHGFARERALRALRKMRGR